MDIEKRINFAVKVLLIEDGKFLVMHKPSFPSDIWELPGGRMEFGETAEQTLIREMKEETWFTVKPIRVLDTWNAVFNDYQITGIIYLCSIVGGEIKLSSEHDKYKWLRLDKREIINLSNVFKERMINWDFDKMCFGKMCFGT